MSPTVPDRSYWGPFAVAIVFGVLALGSVLVVGAVADVPYELLMREPQSALEGPHYAGYFSNLGAVVWLAAAAVMTFAAMLLQGRRRTGLLLAAGLTWALGLDDLFLLHDDVYPALGLSERLVTVLYALTGPAVVWVNREALGRLGVVAGLAAQGLWASSILVDQLADKGGGGPYRIVVEDGAKFAGVCLWAATWIAVSLAQVRTAPPLEAGRPDAPDAVEAPRPDVRPVGPGERLGGPTARP